MYMRNVDARITQRLRHPGPLADHLRAGATTKDGGRVNCPVNQVADTRWKLCRSTMEEVDFPANPSQLLNAQQHRQF
jgi:hypothetical protein